MLPRVVLAARLKVGEGKDAKFPFVNVAIKQGKPVAPENATTYYVRYILDGKRRVQAAGPDLQAAYVTFLNCETEVKSRAAGLGGSSPESALTLPIRPGTTLKAEIEEYLEDKTASGKNTESTLATKKRVLGEFSTVCGQLGISTIHQLRDARTGLKAILAYQTWMKQNLETLNIPGANPENTYCARLRTLGSFLIRHDIQIKKKKDAGPNDKGLVPHDQFPKYRRRKATVYHEDLIQELLKAANEDERDLIEFFIYTGFRDDEAAHCEWKDIDFRAGTINVYAKQPDATRTWGWKSKDSESREQDISLPDNFVSRMKARQDRLKKLKPTCNLIFPNSLCTPEKNLLRRVRRAAKRAGITDRIALHNLRKTYATYIAKELGIEAARVFLGHADIKTTQAYLGTGVDRAEATRAANKMAEKFGGSK